jgi:4-amino-4-deoxy-L-arabinose transferase-like glycosyltransferase
MSATDARMERGIGARTSVRVITRVVPEHVALLFWGTWLLTLGIFFSVARFYHLYYLGILAPAVSALAGIGLVALWKEYRASLANGSTRPWNGWLLPRTVVVTGGYGTR